MNAVVKEEKLSHYRAVFDSPYLSSADIVEPVTLAVSHVTQEIDRTKKTKDVFNTAHFQERELRPGEKLKPMILNATNSKTMAKLAGSSYVEHWAGFRVVIYVENGIKFGRDTVDGLRIRAAPVRRTLAPDQVQMWTNAKAAFVRDGNLNKVLERMDISDEHMAQIKAQCAPQEGAE